MEHFTCFSCKSCKLDYQVSRGSTDIRVTKPHNIPARHRNTPFRQLVSSSYTLKYLRCLKVSVQHFKKHTLTFETALQTISVLPHQKVALMMFMLPALTPSTFQTAKCCPVTSQPCWAGAASTECQQFFCYGDSFMSLDTQCLH